MEQLPRPGIQFFVFKLLLDSGIRRNDVKRHIRSSLMDFLLFFDLQHQLIVPREDGDMAAICELTK